MLRVLILSALLAAGTASMTLAAPSPAPMVAGGFTSAQVSDPDVQKAAKAIAGALATPEWLGTRVTMGPITQAERQVVAGVNDRLTFTLTHAGAMQQGRAVVFQDLKGASRLTSLELAPEHEPLVGTPTATGLPGGYMAQPVGDAMIQQAAARVVQELAAPRWLGRSVRLVGVTRAASQVVAGTNVYVAMTVQDGGRIRPVEAVLYQDPRGAESLSWVAIGTR